MISDAMAFSAEMDAMFDQFASQIGNGYRRRLLVERRLAPETIGQIRLATAIYLAACLEMPIAGCCEEELLAALRARKQGLPNITPNGVLMPKREQTVEYNLLFKAVMQALGEFMPAEMVLSIQPFLHFRIVDGSTDAQVDTRAYATSKMHSDVWAGSPFDSITITMPVMGDAKNITIEFMEMPRELELEYMRPLAEFDQGQKLAPLLHYEDFEHRIGSIFFFDGRLLHRTAKKAPGFRISLDFRFRRCSPSVWKAPPGVGTYDEKMRVPYEPYETLLRIGEDRMFSIAETMAEARERFAGKSPANKGAAMPQIVSLTADPGQGS